MNNKSKIAVFGGTGLLGGAVTRTLKRKGFENVQVVAKETGMDLMNREMVEKNIEENKPEYLFMVAGLVGGINANNTRQADFLYQNTLMILNVLEGIKNKSPKTKILFTGSTCIYPKENPQPINENRFLAGPLEETNKGYAIAKIIGILGCQLYRQQYGISAIEIMPTNLYGPGDNYNLETSHFIPAVIKRMLIAKETGKAPIFWGTGKPRREALFSEDCAEALIFLMQNYDKPEIINVGIGYDHSIKEYVEIAQKIIGYEGAIEWDASKPDGMYEKRTDVSYLKTIMPDFKPRTFEQGVRDVLKADFKF